MQWWLISIQLLQFYRQADSEKRKILWHAQDISILTVPFHANMTYCNSDLYNNDLINMQYEIVERWSLCNMQQIFAKNKKRILKKNGIN